MKLLVTGAAGRIGGAMAAQLLQAGHVPTVLAALSKEHREILPRDPHAIDGPVSAHCLRVCSVQRSATTIVRYRQYFKSQGGLDASAI